VGVRPPKPSGRLILAVLIVLALVTVAAVPARASVHAPYAFRTPSDNIICDLALSSRQQGRLDCAVRSTGTRDEYPKTWSLAAVGRATVARIDNSPNPNGAVLAYGHSFRRGPFRCASSRAGLECRSVLSAHGFFLSREYQRVY
jgi:hypothetical protein